MNALDARLCLPGRGLAACVTASLDFPFSLPVFRSSIPRATGASFSLSHLLLFTSPLQPHGLQFMPLSATLRHAYFH